MEKIYRCPVLVPFVVLVLFFGVMNSSAYAEDYYFGIQAGAVLLNDASMDIPVTTISYDTGFRASYDTGYLIGLTFGSKFKQLRLEGELSYRHNTYKDISYGGVSYPAIGDISSTAFMFNGYYDFNISSFITPYLGAGIGFSQVSINELASGVLLADDDDIVFAYQVAAGVAFNLHKSTTLDLGYKYFRTSEASFTGQFQSEYTSHNFTVGARFNF